MIFKIIAVPKRNNNIPKYIGFREKRNTPLVTKQVDFLRFKGLIVVLLSINDLIEIIKSKKPIVITKMPN